MSVNIGSAYLANLERIKQYLSNARKGGWQEGIEVVLEQYNRGTCFYDRCPDKNVQSDRRIRVTHNEGKRIEFFRFHSECIGSLIKDIRLNSLN